MYQGTHQLVKRESPSQLSSDNSTSAIPVLVNPICTVALIIWLLAKDKINCSTKIGIESTVKDCQHWQVMIQPRTDYHAKQASSSQLPTTSQLPTSSKRI